MAMEIKISTTDMLKVLVTAGIDTTDAKAIIFDLLQYPEKADKAKEVVKENKEPTTRRGRPKKIVPTDINAPEENSNDMNEENNDDATDEDEDEDNLIRKPKRINFKNFGGSIDSLPIKG